LIELSRSDCLYLDCFDDLWCLGATFGLLAWAFNYNNNKNATGELIKNMRWLVQAQTHRTGHSEK